MCIMYATNPPAYPATDDIRYAVWLKNLALRLPEYAGHYQLPISKLLEMHCLALDYIDMLIERMHQATNHICRHNVLPAGQEPLASKRVECERIVSTQKIVGELVAHITQHPAYAPADARELRLPLPGHPFDASFYLSSSPPSARREDDMAKL